jgi:hypothetical protein
MPPGPSERPLLLRLEFIVLLGLGVVVLFLAFMFASTDGHVVPQVVDLYLVCQYARAFAEGHPFRYNVGDLPSTGATSLLYTSLLGFAHWVGARGEGLVAVAIGLGAIFYLLAVSLAYRVAMLISGDRLCSALASALVALGGPTVWGFLYGSDVGLFMFLTLWLMSGMIRGWRSSRPLPWVVPATLLSLTRPEGLLIAPVVALLWYYAERQKEALPLAPTAAAGAVLLLYRFGTGAWVGSSVVDKSLLNSYTLRDSVALVSEYLVGVLRGVLLGLYPPETALGFSKGWAPFYLPPLSLVFVVTLVATARGKTAEALRAFLLTLVLVVVVTSPNIYMGVHFNRYLMFLLPSLLVLVACGFGRVVALFLATDEEGRQILFRWGAALLVSCGALSTLRFATLYGEFSGGVYRRDVAAAEWITRSIREGSLPAHVAAADIATSVEYLTGHRNVNLHGVTSPEFFGNRPAEREAGVFEALGRLPKASRPPILISSVAAQESYPSLKGLVEEPPLFTTTSGGTDDIVIYKMKYDLLDRSGALLLPESLEAVRDLEEVDRMNVCDSFDEKRHGYAYESHLGDLALNGTVRSDSYTVGTGTVTIADAGRAILGEERFRVRTPFPGRELVMVQRTAAAVNATIFRVSGPTSLEVGFQEAGFRVFVDGQSWRTVSLRPRAGWDEVVLRVPATLIVHPETTLRLVGRYGAFYYWFYQ